MPRGSHFFCFAKKSNQKKATPTIGLFLRCSEKKRNGKNSLSLKQFSVLIAFFFRFSGPINGDPVEPKFDRLAMRITSARMRGYGLRR